MSITDANLKASAKTDGSDILFTAADGVTKLNHEIEQYTSATGQLTAWVSIPSLSPATDTTIYLYYGNPSATSQQNRTGVWDTNYKGVWHFSPGAGLNLSDSTSGGNNGTGVATPTASAGKVGGAVTLNGTSQAINVGQSADLNVGAAFTIEAWIKPGTLASRRGIFSTRSSNSAGSWQIEMGNDSDGNADGGIALTGPNTYIADTAGGLLSVNTWTHVVVTKNGSGDTAAIYLNGNPVTLAHHTSFSTLDNTASKFIGEGTTGGQFFQGSIDEVRLSSGVRSAAWIATEYANQNGSAAFLAVGGQQSIVAATVATSPSGLSVTVDGTACVAPCSFHWAAGSTHTIAAATQAAGTGAQYAFANWSDAGTASHSVTPLTAVTYTAGFNLQYQLTALASPQIGGTITPPAGWYNAGSMVSLVATANTGYQFSGFSGAVTSSTSPVALTITAPASVTANFSTISTTTWYATGGTWSNRKPITINHTFVSGTTNLTNFPILVSITDANLKASAKTDGSDILFTAADGVTKLNHEIEQYTSATGQLTAWVSIPSLSPASDTTIYLYYGNPSASSQQNRTGVWDTNYKGVWHFSPGASLNLSDSTSGGNNGTGVATPTASAGKVGGAVTLNGTSQAVNVGQSANLNVGAAFTVEAWVKPASLAARYGIFTTRYSNIGGAWQLEIGNDGNGNGGVALTGLNTYVGDTAGGLLTTNSWAHIVVTKNGPGDNAAIYVNGKPVGLVRHASYTTVDTTAGKFIGEGTAGGQFFPGAIDEVRLSNAVRSPAWIATEYANQNTPGNFLTAAAQQSHP